MKPFPSARGVARHVARRCVVFRVVEMAAGFRSPFFREDLAKGLQV